MAQHKIYSFYAELLDYKPKIWRRFQINGSKTMANLGYTLMTMFEMQASHLFCIEYDAGAEFMKDMLTRHSKEDIERIKWPPCQDTNFLVVVTHAISLVKF